MKMKKDLLYLLTTVLVAYVMNGSAAVAKDIVIHAGQLIDGISEQPRTRMSILITDDRITSVESDFVTPAGVEVIDLSGSTVLPGMIDLHQHIGDGTPVGAHDVSYLATGSMDSVLKMAANAQLLLQQGFTAIRNPGGGFENIALKRAINSGYIVGPRMWVAGVTLGPTGGHSDRRRSADLEQPDIGASLDTDRQSGRST